MDSGPVAITDATELARVRAQARVVHLKSLGTAVVLAVLALLV